MCELAQSKKLHKVVLPKNNKELYNETEVIECEEIMIHVPKKKNETLFLKTSKIHPKKMGPPFGGSSVTAFVSNRSKKKSG